jgi:hypothetical protein
MSAAKILRSFIALLLILYVARVVIPSGLDADRWNLFGLLLFVLLSLALVARRTSSGRSSSEDPPEANADSPVGESALPDQDKTPRSTKS